MNLRTTSIRVALTFVLGMAAVPYACYPVKTVSSQLPTMVQTTDVPTKIYLKDGTVHVFQQGFSVRRVPPDTIFGKSTRYTAGEGAGVTELAAISTGDIATLHTYDRRYTAGRAVANFITASYTAFILPTSIYCLTCPKCCFGSCPTVYIDSDTTHSIQAELFSHAISPLLEDDDVDLLPAPIGHGGGFTLTMTNEALESHFVNAFNVSMISVPKGRTLFPVSGRRFCSIDSLHRPLEAKNSVGTDVLSLIDAVDDEAYRSPDDMVRTLSREHRKDWVEVSIPANRLGSQFLVCRYKNTLMSTILLYDIVLGSQGVRAIDWTQRLSTDRSYAALFSSVYASFSGMTVERLNKGNWEHVARIPDAGPLAWKTVAVPVVAGSEPEVRLRLTHVPDNIMIDAIAWGNGEMLHASAELPLTPVKAIDGMGRDRSDILPMVREMDDDYLENEPGDSYELSYVAAVPKDKVGRIIIRSKGYYYEWIRGGWLERNSKDVAFDLLEIDRTLKELSRRWLADKEEVERVFFQTRVPLRRMP
ncbi:MAG: hypothetical protein A3C56_06920 [Ignavibacteria bacterium RIFCSPHIGHO2_02_FULL_56_12]|nr:MAG: hypothetical protein A3C56_06920 [Ignavibacteria bacterium RIFCSPHIGHO2_02_FULL_56_12]